MTLINAIYCHIIMYMTGKRRMTLWVDEDLALALKVVKDRDGVPEA